MRARIPVILRILAACSLVAWSGLIFIPAQTLFLFQLTVGATEYGHWLAGISLALAVFWKNKKTSDWLITGVFLGSAFLFLQPVFQAWHLAKIVTQEVERVFPGDSLDEKALELKKLWLGTKVPNVVPEKLAYAVHGDTALSLFFQRSTTDTPAPCVILLHTGGWSTGSPQEFLTMNTWLTLHGFAVAALEYRLAPRWTWPAQRTDVLDAIRYLQTHHARLGIDPERFVVLGRSAGGQIAQAVAYGSGNPAIRGCISFYAPADLHFAYRYADPRDILNSLQLVTQYTGGTPLNARANYDSGSGILLVQPNSPPTLLLHGARDELVWVRQSRRLAAVLQRKQARYLYLEFPWATHAFDYNFNGPGGQISRYAVLNFLKNVTAVSNRQTADSTQRVPAR